MADSTLIVALAGGVGALLGSVLAQGMQWWRDMQMRTAERQREVRDHRRQAYGEILVGLQDLLAALAHAIHEVEFSKAMNGSDAFRSRANSALEQLHERFQQTAPETTALAYAQGSDIVITLFATFESNRAYGFESSLPTTRGVASDEPLTFDESIDFKIDQLKSKADMVRVLIHQIRSELSLTDGSSAGYLESDWGLLRRMSKKVNGEEPKW